MVQVTAEEAKARLDDLIAEAINGETVFITQDGKQVAQIVAVSGQERRPQFGGSRGLTSIGDEFDEPLEGDTLNPEDDPILSVLGIMPGKPLTNEEIDEELYGPLLVKEEDSAE